MGAAVPQNYIAFEYPLGRPDWWYDIVEGLPDPIVERGFIRFGTGRDWCDVQCAGGKSTPGRKRIVDFFD